jgi:hypothetical protein
MVPYPLFGNSGGNPRRMADVWGRGWSNVEREELNVLLGREDRDRREEGWSRYLNKTARFDHAVTYVVVHTVIGS